MSKPRKKQKKAEQSPTVLNKAIEPTEKTPDDPPTSLLSNRQAFAALETERDELLLSLMLSLNTETLNRMITLAIEADDSKQRFTKEYNGITIVLTLPNLDSLPYLDQFASSPYQISHIKIDPPLQQLPAEELSRRILTALQQSTLDGFLHWLRFCLLLRRVWQERCSEEAKKIIENSNRVQFDRERQGIDRLKPTKEQELQKIMIILERHTNVLYENFSAVWEKGLTRFLREHPQLGMPENERHLQKLIQILEDVEL